MVKSKVETSIGLVIVISLVSTLLVWLVAGLSTIYQNFDGPYYVAISKSWYDQSVIRNNFSFPLPVEYYPAHFPLYPLLIRLVSLFGFNSLQAMLVVNLLAAAAGAAVIYKIFEKTKWGNPFWVSLAWLFLWPRVWAVRSVGSPEILFVVLVMISLCSFGNKKYWWSAIWGSLAVLAKPPGILLLAAYGLWAMVRYAKTKTIEYKIWPVGLIGLTLVGLFYFFQIRTGDFWAYFKTGDNIHLGLLPFRIFDSNQSWVGSWWLEDILWIYLISGIGIYRAMKKSLVWGMFGLIYFVSIIFVSHRDISRYSLPLVPVVLVGLADLFEKKEVRWGLALLIIPMFFYTLNFVTHNLMLISDWTPLL